MEESENLRILFNITVQVLQPPVIYKLWPDKYFTLKLTRVLRAPVINDQNYWNHRVVEHGFHCVEHGFHCVEQLTKWLFVIFINKLYL